MRSLSFLDTVLCMVATFLVITSLSGAPARPEQQPGLLMVTIPDAASGAPPEIHVGLTESVLRPIEYRPDGETTTSLAFQSNGTNFSARIVVDSRPPTRDRTSSLDVWVASEATQFAPRVQIKWADEKGARNREGALVKALGLAAQRLGPTLKVRPIQQWNSMVLDRLYNQPDLPADEVNSLLESNQVETYRTASSLNGGPQDGTPPAVPPGDRSWKGGPMLSQATAMIANRRAKPDVVLQEIVLNYQLHELLLRSIDKGTARPHVVLSRPISNLPTKDAVLRRFIEEAKEGRQEAVIRQHVPWLYDNTVTLMDFRGLEQGVNRATVEWRVEADAGANTPLPLVLRRDPLLAGEGALHAAIASAQKPRGYGLRYLETVARVLGRQESGLWLERGSIVPVVPSRSESERSYTLDFAPKRVPNQ